MKTFTKEKKDALLAEIEKHRLADQIIQGIYSNNKTGKAWKRCAVGCSIHSLNVLEGKKYETSDHHVYEQELGIPKSLAYLEDSIFEGLDDELAKLWPGRFIAAVSPEADLSLVLPKFYIRILTDPKKGTRRLCGPKGVIATDMVVGLYKDVVDGKEVTKDQWKLAAASTNVAASAYAYAYAYTSANAYAASVKKHYSWMADVLIEILEDTNLTTKV